MNVTITRPIASKITITKSGTTKVVAARTLMQVTVSPSGLQGAAGPSGAGTDATYNCPPTVAAQNAVYLSGDNQVDNANNASPATCDVIGFVVSKPTTTTCVVRTANQLSGFSGLIPPGRYWVSASPGGIMSTPPTVGVVQQVGKAVTAAILQVAIQPRIIL